jgi:hypothetical protein
MPSRPNILDDNISRCTNASLTPAALATWFTVTWTLASSGYWHKKEQHAYGWTRFSFHATGASAIFILIAVSGAS